MPYRRLLTTICLFLAVCVAPWWVVAGIILVALLVFEHFYEALIAGITMDALYSMPSAAPFAWTLYFFVGCAVAFLLAEMGKSRMRFFER